MTEPIVRLQGVSKRFADVVAVAQLDLDIFDGEFLTLLGPSGSGKTTALRLIAGFELPTTGSVHIDGRDVTAEPPYLRDVNTVFQDYALFPHMTVQENIEYGLRVRKISAAERALAAKAALEQVQLAEFGSRKPSQLSGGQRQRVALARAIVNRPRVLLLDEPLGALDLKLRKQMQLELKSMQRELGITFVFVTHDQEEALTMSDRIAVFNKGEVVQLGTPHEIYERPRTEFVADFIGTTNLLDSRDGQRACIRPERITVTTTEPIAGTGKIHQGQVAEIAYLGATRNIIITVGDGHSITATVPAHDAIEPVALGQSVWCSWNPNEEFIITG